MMNNATTKAIENIAAESHCFWSLRWFSASAIIYRFPGYVVTTSNSKLRNVLCFYNDHDWFHCFIFFICHSYNCRQIPGCSSSSQIPGTCDSQRVVIVVILIWVFSILLPLLAFWSPSNVTLGLHTVIQFTCLGAVTICYYEIYRAVRCHSNQIHALKIHQVAPNDQSISVNSLRKSAISAFYVYLVFMVCYLPQNCSFVAAIFYGPLTAIKRLLVFTWTLTFVNSFLNPIVYCWKMRNIRRAVFIVLWRIFSVRKETVESCSYVSRTASYAN